MRPIPRLHLAHTPTPIDAFPQFPEIVTAYREASGRPVKSGRSGFDGPTVFIKRDDMSAGAEAGNKIRKLEFLLAEAKVRGADTLITCGGLQSNHARATALLGARLGLETVLLLRTTEEVSLPALTGNVLLDRLAGATVRLITPAQYRERASMMADVAGDLARKGRVPYVIAEGGSTGVGSLGYVRAMEEIRRQLDLGLHEGRPFDVVIHACGSGGTAAGVQLGARLHRVAEEVWAMAVCDDAPTFEAVIARIVKEAQTIDPTLTELADLSVRDSSKGPAYGVATAEQRRLIGLCGRKAGLVLDPVYTGKAFHGLVEATLRGELAGKRVLFLHTGGLPGLLGVASDFADLEAELGQAPSDGKVPS